MADNDRFKIIKIENMCKNCLQARDTCMQVCEPEKGLKTRAEYEDMIAESIYKKQVELLKNKFLMGFICENDYSMRLIDIETDSKDLAKAVVGRLFGEGE